MRSKDNRQINVPLPRGSDVEAFYIEEAKRRRVGLPTHIAQLLDDRFNVLSGRAGKDIWFPRGVPVPTSAPPVVNTKKSAAIRMFGGEDED